MQKKCGVWRWDTGRGDKNPREAPPATLANSLPTLNATFKYTHVIFRMTFVGNILDCKEYIIFEKLAIQNFNLAALCFLFCTSCTIIEYICARRGDRN